MIFFIEFNRLNDDEIYRVFQKILLVDDYKKKIIWIKFAYYAGSFLEVLNESYDYYYNPHYGGSLFFNRVKNIYFIQ